MLFNSAEFLIFFPIAALVYFVLPHRVRYLWLLACSYYFYMCWNPVYERSPICARWRWTGLIACSAMSAAARVPRSSASR